jgi:uncharacterized protein (TIGR00266 family)
MQYSIVGEPMPVVICNVNPGETLITERGSMSWMTPNMNMETTTNGGIGKAFGRAFSGESMFQNRYTAMGGPGQIAFASSFPGSIRALNIGNGVGYIAQKGSFLACTEGVTLSVYLQKKFGAGLVGGEGFIMQQLTGQGIAFIEIDGYACEYNLVAGQSMVVDTGYLALMENTCRMEIVSTGGAKNALLGGEGFFNTVVHGPGKIILQSMPIRAMARSLAPYIATGR